MCLVRSRDLQAGGAQAIRQARGEERVRAGAEALAMLIVPVGNGYAGQPAWHSSGRHE